MSKKVTSALPQAGSRRIYVRTFVQTTSFYTKNHACASTDYIFMHKNLQI